MRYASTRTLIGATQARTRNSHTCGTRQLAHATMRARTHVVKTRARSRMQRATHELSRTHGIRNLPMLRMYALSRRAAMHTNMRAAGAYPQGSLCSISQHEEGHRRMHARVHAEGYKPTSHTHTLRHAHMPARRRSHAHLRARPRASRPTNYIDLRMHAYTHAYTHECLRHTKHMHSYS